MSAAPPEPIEPLEAAPAPPPASGEAAWTSPPLSPAEWIVALVGLVYTQLPWRNLFRDVSVFLALTLAVVAWRAKLPPRPARRGAAAEGWLLAWTLGGGGLLLGYGLHTEAQGLRPLALLLTFLLYVPFAALQQWLTLRYMVQRVSGRLLGGRSFWAALVGGLAFGLCHLPFPKLIAPTLVSGVLWALAWRSGARLWAITLSHAFLGALIFLSVIRADPFGQLWALR